MSAEDVVLVAVEVVAAMAPWRGLYVTHVRYKKGTLEGVREAVEIGQRAEGTGSSRRRAEQEAAEHVLKTIEIE